MSASLPDSSKEKVTRVELGFMTPIGPATATVKGMTGKQVADALKEALRNGKSGVVFETIPHGPSKRLAISTFLYLPLADLAVTINEEVDEIATAASGKLILSS